jgi:hypothetical protein
MNIKKILVLATVVVSSFASATGFLFNVPQGLSARTYHNMALVYAQQAEQAYPTAFADLPLWNEALAHAAAAVNAEPDSVEYTRTATLLFAKTQWWTPAFEYAQKLETMNALDSQTRQAAALSARKLAFSALQRGDRLEAATYLRASLRHQPDEAMQLLLNRLESNAS